MSATPQAGRGHLLQVVSYNIHYCIGIDRQFSPTRIARIIRQLRADVIVLQEVGWHYRGRSDLDQFAFLHEHTGYPVYSGLTRSHERAHFGNAILTRHPLLRHVNHDLSVPLRAPRGAVDITIDLGACPVRVIGTHLGLDPWERREQVERLAALIDPDVPTVLTGDFNEWRLSPDAMAGLRAKLPRMAAPPSFHTRRPMLRYDRVYASHQMMVLGSGVERTSLTRRASDHLPVYAHLEVEGEPAAAGVRDMAETVA